MRKHILSLAILSGMAVGVYAQSPLAGQFYSHQDGLADWTVTALTKDPRGLLWIGTAHGLQRLDGYNFLHFSPRAGTTTHISNFHVDQVQRLGPRHLAIFYERNLKSFDLLDWNSFALQQVVLTDLPGEVRKISADAHGNLLVVTLDATTIRAYCYDWGRHKLRFCFRLDGLALGEPATHWVSIAALGKERYLLADNHLGTFLVDQGVVQKKFSMADFQEKKGALTVSSLGEPFFLYPAKSGRVYAAYQNYPGVFVYAAEKRKFLALDDLPQRGVYPMIWEDQRNNLLFANAAFKARYPPVEALYCLSHNGGFRDFSSFLEQDHYLTGLYADDFFSEFYLGFDTGLKVVRNNQAVVRNYLAEPLDANQFGRVMRGIVSDGKRYVYFTLEDSEWFRLDRQTQRLDTLRLVDEKTAKPLVFSCSFQLKLDSVGGLWGVACQGRGKGLLIRHDLDRQTTRVFRYPGALKGLAQQSNGHFLLLVENQEYQDKLVIFDPVSTKFSSVVLDKAPENLHEFILNGIIPGDANDFWIATNQGLYHLLAVPSSPRHFTMEAVPAFAGQIVYALFYDAPGKLWVGTTYGLNLYQVATRKLRFWGVEDGLPSSVVSGILKDRAGRIWVSTHDGLGCLEKMGNHLTSFYDLDGFTHSSFTRYSYFQDNDGMLYFGTVNGVNAFRPEYLLRGESVPQVVLTEVAKYHRKKGKWVVLDRNHHAGETIVLEPQESNLTINFSLPVYIQPNKHQYWYKLLPGPDKWVSLGGQHQLSFAQLPPGHHRLLIRGADARGNYHSNALEIKMVVRQAFHRQAWFRWLVVALLLGLLGLGLRYRLQQRQALERLRTKLASDIHDEVSGLLAGIAMQAEVLQWEVQEEKVNQKLQRIGEVSRKAMARLYDVIWAADARKDNLDDLLVRMQEHANDVLSPVGIDYHIQAKKLPPLGKVPFYLRQDLFYIFQEAINNVAKHGQANRVEVTLRQTPQHFEMLIRDNGTKEPSLGIRKGQGLHNMEMRAQRLKGELRTYWDEGFRVELRVKKFL